MAEVNELLREHVLRTRFELVLTKTQITALVELDANSKREAPYPTWVHFHGLRGMEGLQRRGLVRVEYWPAGLDPTYAITRAGELVVELLKESGIYQHYVSDTQADPVPRG